MKDILYTLILSAIVITIWAIFLHDLLTGLAG